MTNIEELLRKAIKIYKAKGPEERAALDRESAISFVYGNLKIENDSITREMVEQAFDKKCLK